MTRSSYLVNVTVEGAAGRGTVSVPVVAQSTTRLAMPAAYGVGARGPRRVLVAGLLTMVGAAVREGVLPPGQAPDRARLRRARVGHGRGGAASRRSPSWRQVVVGRVDRDYRRGMYKPLAVRAAVVPGAPAPPRSASPSPTATSSGSPGRAGTAAARRRR
jgi:hypothetical protein